MPRPEEPLLAELPGELVGERVVVRPFQEDEAPILFAAVAESREHLRQWLPWPDYHQTVEDTLVFIRRSQGQWLLRQEFGVGIFARDTGHLLGGSGIHVRNWHSGYFEIGYWARAGAQGHGYVSEAVKLLASFAFTTWDAERVEIRCDALNGRSAHVAQRLGFVEEGTLRLSGLSLDGGLRDTKIFALTAEDFSRVSRSWKGQP